MWWGGGRWSPRPCLVRWMFRIAGSGGLRRWAPVSAKAVVEVWWAAKSLFSGEGDESERRVREAVGQSFSWPTDPVPGGYLTGNHQVGSPLQLLAS